MGIEIEHVDTWADHNGIWAILRVVINGRETVKIVKVG